MCFIYTFYNLIGFLKINFSCNFVNLSIEVWVGHFINNSYIFNIDIMSDLLNFPSCTQNNYDYFIIVKKYPMTRCFEMQVTKWAPLGTIQDDINRLFDTALRGGVLPLVENGLEGRQWAPEIDIYEKDDSFVIETDIPGRI